MRSNGKKETMILVANHAYSKTPEKPKTRAAYPLGVVESEARRKLSRVNVPVGSGTDDSLPG